MPHLPASIVPILWSFAPLFTAPTWRHVQVLLTGTLLAQGPRTVTAALRVMGLAHAPRFERYHRVLSRGRWSGVQGPGCPDGTAEFRFDTAPAPDTGPGTPPRPAVPPAYQAWLCQRYSGIDLLGQPVQQGQAVTLRQVYVPAVTTPERPSEPTPDRGEGPPPALLLQRLAVTSLYCPGPAGAGKSTFCRWAVVPGLPGPVPAHPVLGRGLGGRHLQQQRGQARGDLPGRALPPLPAGPAAAR